MQPTTLQIWTMAIRPKTLPASIAPVVMGTAMAYGDGIHHFPSAALALLAALLIQIGTNLANDYGDFKKGADTSERIGPVRITQAGLISPKVICLVTVLIFILAALVCLWLVKRGGWPIFVIGILSIASGIFYTAGPRPLGYMGLGELFVLIFFGPVAVAGTYYVQSLEINLVVILAGLGPGLLSVALLIINNIRDIAGDRKSGKRTLAVRLGRGFATNSYLLAVFGACLIPVLLYIIIEDHKFILLSSFVGIKAIPSIQRVYTSMEGPGLNAALAATGRLLLAYSLIFSLGWIL